MAPSPSIHLLSFAVPILAFLAGYFWYRRKTGNPQSDHADPANGDEKFSAPDKIPEGGEGNNNKLCPPVSPTGSESAPIDIIVPHTLRSRKSQQQFISDEDLDQEIEKMKSSKYSSKGKAGSGGSTRTASKNNNANKRRASSKTSPKASLSSNNSYTDTDGSPQSVQQPIIIRCTPQKIIISSSNTSTNVSPCDSAQVDFKSPDTTGKVNGGVISSVHEASVDENEETTSSQIPVEDVKELKNSERVNPKPEPSQIPSNISEFDSGNSHVILNGNAEKCKETLNDVCKNSEGITEPDKVEDVPSTNSKQDPSDTTLKVSSEELCTKSCNDECLVDEVGKSNDTDNVQVINPEMNSNHNSIDVILDDNFGESDTKTFDKWVRIKSAVESNNNDIEDLRRTSERDSANHSPTDVMLGGSPSCSSISDNNSEASNDSGKGGSEMMTTPPSLTPAVDSMMGPSSEQCMLYETEIPQHLVGRLIGRNGSSINEIKQKSGARITVRKYTDNSRTKICAVEGTGKQIDDALRFIREKFPIKRYPDIKLEQIVRNTVVDFFPEKLQLVEGVNNDTVVTAMIAPNHFFLHLLTHPSFLKLSFMNGYIMDHYNNHDAPTLPQPISEYEICVAYCHGTWYRVMILSSDPELNTSHILFLDYGGYAFVENSNLRQIDGNLMKFTFQAIECMLANIRPVGGVWHEDAYNFTSNLTRGQLIMTQVADYTVDNIPLVLMYIITGPQEFICLNDELVNRGFAEEINAEEGEVVEGAVGGIVA